MSGPQAKMSATPSPIRRPALARWVWERFTTLREAGVYFGVSREAIRTVCLPFGHPARSVPGRDLMARIHERTAGAITPDSFHELAPPATNAVEAQP